MDIPAIAGHKGKKVAWEPAKRIVINQNVRTSRTPTCLIPHGPHVWPRTTRASIDSLTHTVLTPLLSHARSVSSSQHGKGAQISLETYIKGKSAEIGRLGKPKKVQKKDGSWTEKQEWMPAHADVAACRETINLEMFNIAEVQRVMISQTTLSTMVRTWAKTTVFSATVVLRLFLGSTCPAITVATVISWSTLPELRGGVLWLTLT